MKSAVTICLDPEARDVPFVFHGGLAESCGRAATHGFDAIEIFPASADAVDAGALEHLLVDHGLSVAAVGSGAGWLLRELTLTSPDSAVRLAARRFVAAIIDLASHFRAPAIIGSVQGRLEAGQNRDQALAWLREALEELGDLAASYRVPLLLEPLNRYETNLFNRLGQTAEFLQTLGTRNIRILADLFHMNIEETDLAAALREADRLIGHVHLADSNRQAIGFGHTDVGPLISTLRLNGYAGFLSAEVLPLPTADAAAQQTISAMRRLSP